MFDWPFGQSNIPNTERFSRPRKRAGTVKAVGAWVATADESLTLGIPNAKLSSFLMKSLLLAAWSSNMNIKLARMWGACPWWWRPAPGREVGQPEHLRVAIVMSKPMHLTGLLHSVRRGQRTLLKRVHCCLVEKDPGPRLISPGRVSGQPD